MLRSCTRYNPEQVKKVRTQVWLLAEVCTGQPQLLPSMACVTDSRLTYGGGALHYVSAAVLEAVGQCGVLVGAQVRMLDCGNASCLGDVGARQYDLSDQRVEQRAFPCEARQPASEEVRAVLTPASVMFPPMHLPGTGSKTRPADRRARDLNSI